MALSSVDPIDTTFTTTLKNPVTAAAVAIRFLTDTLSDCNEPPTTSLSFAPDPIISAIIGRELPPNAGTPTGSVYPRHPFRDPWVLATIGRWALRDIPIIDANS